MSDDEWAWSAARRQWEHPSLPAVTEVQIALDETLAPDYTPPPPAPSIGMRVLGFEYGSEECYRQRLSAQTYYQLIDAVLRARRKKS